MRTQGLAVGETVALPSAPLLVKYWPIRKAGTMVPFDSLVLGTRTKCSTCGFAATSAATAWFMVFSPIGQRPVELVGRLRRRIVLLIGLLFSPVIVRGLLCASHAVIASGVVTSHTNPVMRSTTREAAILVGGSAIPMRRVSQRTTDTTTSNRVACCPCQARAGLLNWPKMPPH